MTPLQWKTCPYEDGFTLNICAINGGDFDVMEQKLYNAKQYGLIKRYSGHNFPSRQELLDDIATIDLLEGMESTGHHHTDFGEFPVFPRFRRDFFRQQAGQP